MNGGYVYLIGLYNETNLFKIGVTKAKDLNKRIKQLQTGNGDEMYLVESFFTNKPYKMETYLHSKYKDLRCNGEWFYFEDWNKLKKEFIIECNNFQSIINSLKDNPFF